MRFFAAIIAAVLLLTGCGSNDKQVSGTPTPAPTTAAPVAASTTPTVTPSAPPKPTVLTREQAGARYLAIIKPSNAVFAEPKCKESEEIFVSGGTWPNDHPDRVVRACFKRLVPLEEKFIAELQGTPWPADARADVADLISQEQAYLHCMKKGARAASYDAMSEVYSGCLPEDDGSADRVRARFGLPIR